MVSDEIYHGLVYEGKEHTVLEFTDKRPGDHGFSKLYAMTVAAGLPDRSPGIIRPLQKLHKNFFISANAFVSGRGSPP